MSIADRLVTWQWTSLDEFKKVQRVRTVGNQMTVNQNTGALSRTALELLGNPERVVFCVDRVRRAVMVQAATSNDGLKVQPESGSFSAAVLYRALGLKKFTTIPLELHGFGLIGIVPDEAAS